MRRLILLLCLLFVFTSFAQENIPFNLPVGPADTIEPSTPSDVFEPQAGPPQIELPKIKIPVIDEPKPVTEVRTEESKVFLDFRDADIREVARILSKISGVSILIGEDVKAKVTLNIEGVTWKRALELILRTYNLAMIERDDFIIVVTYKKIQEEQEQIPLKTEIIRLNFVDIDKAKTYLQSVLSKRGTIEGDDRTNSLIVTDTPEAIEKTREIVKGLDIKTPQVLIEVLMIDKEITDDLSLGIDWSLTDEETEGTDLARSLAQTLPVTGPALALNYGTTMFKHTEFQAAIQALASDSNVDIIANPKILTLDNITAKIKLVEQIPYTSETTSAEGGTSTSTQFKDSGVTLSVKPHITPDGHIILDVETEQSFLVRLTPDTNEPVIDSRTSESTMMILDGQTVVIGGLRKKNDTTTFTRVPLLGDIPIIGRLFTKEITTTSTKEFLIFITPTVLEESLKVAGVEENKKVIAENLAHDRERRKSARALVGYEDHSIDEDLDEAEEVEPSVEDLDETSELASQFYQMARSSYRNKDYLKAQELFTKVYDLDPNYKNTTSYLELTAKAIARKDLLEKAKQEAQQIQEEKARKAQEEKAQKEKELELAQQTSKIYQSALSSYRNKDYNQAKELFSGLQKINPDYKRTLYYLDEIPKTIEKQKAAELAKQEAQKAQEEKKRKQKQVQERRQKELEGEKATSDLYVKAVSLYRSKNYDAAADLFAEVNNLNPDYKQTSYYIESIPEDIQKQERRKKAQEEKEQRQRQAQEARQEARQEVQRKREEAKAKKQEELQKNQIAAELYQKALSLYGNKGYDNASELFIEVQKIKPGYRQTDYYLAKIPQEIKKQAEIRKFEELGKKEFQRTQIIAELYKKAIALYKNKDYEKAKAMFAEVEGMSSGYKRTQQYLKTIAKAKERKKRLSRRQKTTIAKGAEVEKQLPDFSNLDILPLKRPNE